MIRCIGLGSSVNQEVRTPLVADAPMQGGVAVLMGERNTEEEDEVEITEAEAMGLGVGEGKIGVI